jgi:hypothetical protein
MFKCVSMKTQLSIIYSLVALSFLSLSPCAHAQGALPLPGYLSDYQYQVANVSSDEAQALMQTETKQTSDGSICANRADVWSFIMNKQAGTQVGKVFIHFTAEGEANENKQWAYHVAPYILIDGEEYVLDGGFDVFHHQPVKLADWMQYFGKDNCAVLDPVHNPGDLALEQNDLPNDSVTPLTYTKGGARQYPSENGHKCYIRKAPMYYVYPIDVYAADLALAGQNEYSSYLLSAFDQGDALQACNQALDGFYRMSHSCKSYLGIKKAPKAPKVRE